MSQNITAQVRKKFIDYFQKQDHVIVPASSLVPKNDPTLMFTNSGMVQFKNYFNTNLKTTLKYSTNSYINFCKPIKP